MRAIVAALLPCVAFGQSDAPPLPRAEARAAWVATVSNIDWPSSRTLSPTAQRAEAIVILDRLVALRMNICVFQVRTECDALYNSPFEPWSRFLTGTQGVGPSDGYDPLAFWTAEAHKRGIELHAWFNPYRAQTSTTAANASTHVSTTNPSMVKTYDRVRILDPGHPDSDERFLRVIDDVVRRYDVDGVHIDDYFYPYPVSGIAFPDDDTYAASGTTLSRAFWRRKNVDDLVQRYYSTVKAAKPWVKVGISPFGIWRPGNPAGVVGLDAYASIYADSRRWLWEGWLDYISPQMYWKIGSSGQPYGPLLQWWSDQNLRGRHVWPGNFTSGVNSATPWDASEIVNQVTVTRADGGATGNVHFSMTPLRLNSRSVGTALTAGPYADVAMVPPSRWLDAVPPSAPSLSLARSGSGWRAAWVNRATEPVRRWIVSVQYGRAWTQRVIDGNLRSLDVAGSGAGGKLARVTIRAVDRAGNPGKVSSVLVPRR